MFATVVETQDLISTVIASFIAGLGVTAAFSLMIFGAARFADLRRDDRHLLAAMAAVLVVLGFAITAAGIVVGIVEMTAKG